MWSFCSCGRPTFSVFAQLPGLCSQLHKKRRRSLEASAAIFTNKLLFLKKTWQCSVVAIPCFYRWNERNLLAVNNVQSPSLLYSSEITVSFALLKLFKLNNCLQSEEVHDGGRQAHRSYRLALNG